jgi:hypothetical protein
MVILGEKKKLDLHISGFESARIYNCATGEILIAENEISGTLLYDEPFIITFEGISNLYLKEE